MKTRLGCLSNKSDSYSDFSEFLPPAHETTARCLKLSTDEVVRWSESFDHLLSHKYGLAAFRTFLKTEFSDENIEFWMACEEYKKIKSSTKMVSRANKIFTEFIDVQAPREGEDQAEPGGPDPEQPQRSPGQSPRPHGEGLLPAVPQVQDVPGDGEQGPRTRPAAVGLNPTDDHRWT
ncbi:regulator of G-protein signaling 8 isoform X3 [Hippoglossus stenolepis]|nr:regulator of G-protein signaling 8 isoform X3 [Hippoglossus stenolepis]XP_035033429.1 regulator of G-protein signaling 8 isoform X3 [Hippoglossus stenolepis]XP_035033430.1 regulator of G-protein signaling 8 isoform X3 [Hippoglossus stenolepis]